jgi:RNA polymerase sigma-70 factor (ECF subfamily)
MESGSGAIPAISDESIMARIAEGDAVAFAEFYDRHAGILLGVTRRILDSLEEAEDALQEALCLVWERAPLYNPAHGRPLSWAIALTRNKAIDQLRSRQRRTGVLVPVDPLVQEAVTVFPVSDVPLFMDDELQQVRRAVLSLPPDQRSAIELAFFSGLTHPEVAVAVAAPLGTVKARIRRGLMTMRDGLEGCL